MGQTEQLKRPRTMYIHVNIGRILGLYIGIMKKMETTVLYRGSRPKMENRMEKNMEHEMEAKIILVFMGFWVSQNKETPI